MAARLLPVLLLLARPAWAGAVFSTPFVDVAPNMVSSNALIAVWSATDSYVTKNSQVNIAFPPDLVVPVGLNPATCECIFLKHTSTTAGAWGVNEVTITAGSFVASSQLVSISVPADLHPGKFYIRFDTSANFVTGAGVGLATLSITDPSGNTTLSRGFYIRPTYTATVDLGVISGTVKTSAGKTMAGALVYASNTGSFMPISLAARRGWLDARGTTANVYTTATFTDGRYSLTVPPGTYALKAEVWNHKGGVANSTSQTINSVSVGANGSVWQAFGALGTLP